MAGYPGRLGRRLTEPPAHDESRRLRLAAAVVVTVLAAALFGGCELFEAESGPFSVQGSVYSWGAFAMAELHVRRGAAVVDDARIRVNGTQIPFDLQAYRAIFAVIPPATPVVFELEFDDIDVTETLMMPDMPVVTTPPAPAYDLPIPISWTIGTPPAYFVVLIQHSQTLSGKTWAAALPGSASGHTIPAFTFFPSPTSVLQVFAFHTSEDLGRDFSEGSSLHVGISDNWFIDTN